MRDQQIYGTALIIGTLAFLGTGALHPNGSQLLASAESFSQHGPINVLAHSLALIGLWLTAFGIVGLARRVGAQRPDVTAGLVAYAIVVVLISFAGVVDGIVSTRLAGAYVASDVEQDRVVLAGFMQYSTNLASSISRVYVTGTALAMLLWSWAIWRTGFDRRLPWVGVAIAAIGLGAQALGYLRMNVGDVILLAVGPGVWFVWAGSVRFRAPSIAAPARQRSATRQ